MNNKKIICEIILIPACILYLILSFLKSDLVSEIIFAFCAVAVAFWLVPKYIDELYVYKSKTNFLKLIYVIATILLGVVSILNLFFKFKVLKILLIIGAVIVAIELLHYGIKNLKVVMSKKKDMGINILYSFSAFTLLAIMISTIIIYLK